MREIALEKKALFHDRLMKIRQQLSAFKPANTLESLEQFENQLTLDEIEACFFNSEPEINASLVSFFSSRWERICHTNLCYTQQPHNEVNLLCLDIAKDIAPPASTDSEREALQPKTGPYCLLMPSLENSIDIYGENIHTLGLHEFVLSDNAKAYIPLALCLHDASVSDEGTMRHLVALDGEYPKLTPHEIERVSQHSRQAGEVYIAVETYNHARLYGHDIGPQLSQLVVALREGGAHRGGTEYNSGTKANEGIVHFHQYWETLSEQLRLEIFTETPALKDILGRLFRPNYACYQETRFCVELIANALDPIVQQYLRKPTTQKLKDRVSEKAHAFNEALKTPYTLAFISKEKAPKHILHHIFKLDKAVQKALFKSSGDENALIYALKHDIDALEKFEWDDTSKQDAISAQVYETHETGLILAAKAGNTRIIKLLLSLGAKIESSDVDNNTALHWAASSGYIDVVRCLLDHGASLDAGGYLGDTPLNMAISRGQRDVVDLLLEKNANINERNTNGLDALDLAIKYHPECMEPLLKKMATLPQDEQAAYLMNMPNGPHPNVLFYAASHHPNLFHTLVTLVLPEHHQSVFNAPNQRGEKSLHLAAKIGSHESVKTLLDYAIPIESSDVDNDTALHWAAYNGHIDVVRCLFDHGASLDARGYQGDTPLNMAISRGQRDVVDLLLEKNANINERNTNGLNALDLAIKYHPECMELLLKKMATLPPDEQASCLQNMPNGPYPNVLFYAASHHPNLFHTLVTLVLPEHHQSVFNAPNQRGEKSLHLAAKIGSHESVKTLLDYAIPIESSDVDNDTALHWAAYNGHIDVVRCLLDHGASLDAGGYLGDTPLNMAISRGQRDVVDLLLEKNANINKRNTNGLNALDLAIKYRPEYMESLLKKIATLPQDEQARCLMNVPNGPYEDVFEYICTEKHELFDKIFKKNDDNINAILNNMDFDNHIYRIYVHYHLMKKKSSKNSEYKKACLAAKELLIQCGKEKAKLYQGNGSLEEIAKFKKNCKAAIEKAKPVLEKHRSLSKVIAAFLVALITLPVSLPLYAAGIFSIKTKSNRLLDQLDKAIEQDKPRH